MFCRRVVWLVFFVASAPAVSSSAWRATIPKERRAGRLSCGLCAEFFARPRFSALGRQSAVTHSSCHRKVTYAAQFSVLSVWGFDFWLHCSLRLFPCTDPLVIVGLELQFAVSRIETADRALQLPAEWPAVLWRALCRLRGCWHVRDPTPIVFFSVCFL
jgi:hypothetical protein